MRKIILKLLKVFYPTLQAYYNLAVAHRKHHKGGCIPYKQYLYLHFAIKKYILNINNKSLKILEIGTATGFTAFTINQICKKHSADFKIDTIEKNPEHISIASEQLSSLKCSNINIIEGKAEEIIQNLKDQSYDIIFFDAFAPKEKHAHEFNRILKNYGILISANSFLKKTETEYFEYFKKEQYTKIDEFDDTNIWQKNINKNIKKNLNLKSFHLFF